MAVNLASKYEKQIDERFKLGSLTDSATNKDYSWEGVNAITIYSIPTVPMNDYTRSGLSRYGTANELDNEIQTLVLTQDRSFTFTIDKGNKQDTQMVMDAGKALNRQIDEVIIPEIDTYRLSTMSAAAIGAGGVSTGSVTKSNAYEKFLAAGEYMDENKVPAGGRIAFVTPAFLSLIKQDSSFIKSTEIAQKMLINGQVGEIDGVKIVKVPSTYFPADHSFIVAHPSATVAPSKLQDYKIHQNPPGINGWLTEGRNRYDAFVLDNKDKALFVHKTA